MSGNLHPLINLAVLIGALLLSACTPTAAPVPASETVPISPPTNLPPTSLPASPITQPSPFEMSTQPGSEWNLVVIGDSSLWGLGEALAAQIEKDTGVNVILDDFALPSLTAGAVLAALQTGISPNFRLAGLSAALQEAEVVVMFTNPEESVDPENPLRMDGCFGCSAPKSCSPDTFNLWRDDLEMIWGEIFILRTGQPTILRATDLYNPLVSQWNSCETFTACTVCFENLSQAARQAAEAYGIPFLSRYDAFNGPDHSEDPRQKGYIRNDGEHPTELASQFTAGLLSGMGYEPVPPPQE